MKKVCGYKYLVDRRLDFKRSPNCKGLFLSVVLLAICSFCILYGFLDKCDLIVNANVSSSASSMIVMEVGSNRILYEQNAYSKKFMASTTKILTAITVLENTNITDMVTITKPAVDIEGSSIYLQVGEKISVIDLLYGLMLRSGNDAAVALAMHTSDSVENFAKLMNAVAIKAGANSSNFVNPHGLHNDNHYTTAYDLAVISAYALKNSIFAKIVSTATHTFDRDNENKTKCTFNNKNKILKTVKGGDGIKTGFTKKAGRCLVSSATRDGMQVVCVVLNCGPMFEESAGLIERAFKEYQLVEILPSYTYSGTVQVKNGKTSEVRTYTKLPIVYPLRAGEEQFIVKIIECDELTAPIKRNQEIGVVKIYLHNRLLFSQKLYSIDSVKSLQIIDMLRDFLDDWF